MSSSRPELCYVCDSAPAEAFGPYKADDGLCYACVGEPSDQAEQRARLERLRARRGEGFSPLDEHFRRTYREAKARQRLRDARAGFFALLFRILFVIWFVGAAIFGIISLVRFLTS